MLNEDYKEMLQALFDEKVRFLVVGAYAMAAHGFPRATMDIDLWVEPSPENAKAVLRAIQRFGAPLLNLTETDFQQDDTVFQIGMAPRRIDIMTGASGLRFAEAYIRSLQVEIEGLPIRILSLDDLIQNKRASGRPKDLLDAAVLESLKRGEGPK